MRKLLLVVPLLLALASCAGITARNEVLLPATQAAWSGPGGVQSDVVAGIDAGVADKSLSALDADNLRLELASFDSAVVAGDRSRFSQAAWDKFEAIASAGIQRRLGAGSIGPLAAESLRIRLKYWGQSYSKLTPTTIH